MDLFKEFKKLHKNYAKIGKLFYDKFELYKEDNDKDNLIDLAIVLNKLYLDYYYSIRRLAKYYEDLFEIVNDYIVSNYIRSDLDNYFNSLEWVN